MERNIYKIGKELFVTSDEEIKEGDWFLPISGIGWKLFDLLKAVKSMLNAYNNSHCKKIILTTDPDLIKDGIQAIDDEFLEWFVKNSSCEYVEVKQKQHFEPNKTKRANPLNGVYYSYKIIIPKEEPKQETVEEASMTWDYLSFEAGAKWQAERMYSEEEIIKAYYDRNDEIDIDGYWVDAPEEDIKRLIKQLKKEKKLCV